MKPREAHQSELALRNFGKSLEAGWGFPGGSVVKNPPANAGDTGDSGLIPEPGRSPGEGHMTTHSSILARRIPWTEKHSRLWSRGSKHACCSRMGWSEELFLEMLIGVLRQSGVRTEICDSKFPPRRARPLAYCGEGANTTTSILGRFAKMKAETSTDFWTPMFTEIFAIVQRWKPKSTDEWVNKMWSLHIVEYYSALKKNEMTTHVTTGM